MDSSDVSLQTRLVGCRPTNTAFNAQPGNHKALDDDARQLARFGKKQQLLRRFGVIPVVGLVCTLLVTWEGVLMVALLAPPKYSKFLSYVAGWINVIAWQVAGTPVLYTAAEVLEGITMLEHPQYSMTDWQQTLVMIAVLTISLLTNTLLARQFPTLETIILLVHVLGFFGVFVPLVYLSPKDGSRKIFDGLENPGGWSSPGLAFLIGTSQMMTNFIGVDGATHLAEEIPNASKVIPRAMMVTVLLNGITGLAMLLALFFCATDLNAAINSPIGQPFIVVFQQAVGTAGGATAMVGSDSFLASANLVNHARL
ncbi:MAG: hypothetical protein Q9159_002752 [Coniocarpon cinnabarinum]